MRQPHSMEHGQQDSGSYQPPRLPHGAKGVGCFKKAVHWPKFLFNLGKKAKYSLYCEILVTLINNNYIECSLHAPDFTK